MLSHFFGGLPHTTLSHILFFFFFLGEGITPRRIRAWISSLMYTLTTYMCDVRGREMGKLGGKGGYYSVFNLEKYNFHVYQADALERLGLTDFVVFFFFGDVFIFCFAFISFVWRRGGG